MFKNFNLVSEPLYQLQHRGYTAGGPQDRFSCAFGNLMLGNKKYDVAVEVFIFPFTYKVNFESLFVITGADSEVTLNDKSINRYQVYHAKKDDIIKFSKPKLGIRCYLCMSSDIDNNKIGIKRTSYSNHNSWVPKHNTVRATKGPEYYEVIKWINSFRILKTSDMGVSLFGKLEATKYDIISSPVNDGTIQLTKSGLIILMRCRQTIGGYPRILNLINCDVDILAQMKEGASLRIQLIELEEAKKLETLQEKNLYESVL